MKLLNGNKEEEEELNLTYYDNWVWNRKEEN